MMNNLPVGWINNDLRTVLEKIIDYRGQSVPKADTGVPLITARNVKKGYLDFSSKEYVDEALYSVWMSRGVPVSTDILFTTEAPLGNACRYPSGEKYAIGQRIVCLRAKKNILDSDYLLYFLLSDHGQTLIDIKSSGSTAKGIKSSELKKIKITYPESISEQIKIAEILSTWDDAINTVQKLLANSQQQKKSLMQQLLTGKKRFAGFEGEWEKVSLSAIFDKISNGLTYDPQAVEGLPVTRIETISTGKINYDKVGWAIDDKNTKRFTLEKGDILYSHINSLEHIGRVAFYQAEKPLYHGMNLLLLRAKSGVSKEFIFYVLNSFIGKKYAKTYAKSAVNQASISTTDIKSFKVFIPVLEEQQKIAAVLTTADQEIDNLRAQLNHLKQEKKALMQQLLTGKRRVKIEEAA